jgi:hypothetical protein
VGKGDSAYQTLFLTTSQISDVERELSFPPIVLGAFLALRDGLFLPFTVCAWIFSTLS